LAPFGECEFTNDLCSTAMLILFTRATLYYSADGHVSVSLAVCLSVSAEPALGIGKLGSRLGPPTGGGLAQEHKKKSLDYSQFIQDFAAIKARKVDFC